MAFFNGKKIVLFAMADKPEQSKSVTITENGTTAVLPDENKTLAQVTVTVAIPEYDGEIE